MALSTTGMTHEKFDGPYDTFTLAAEVDIHLLVSRDATTASQLNLASAVSEVIGVSAEPGDPDAANTASPDISIKLISSPGYFTVRTDAATVAVGQHLWQQANGKVGTTVTGGMLFEAMSTLTGTAGLVLVRPIPKTRTIVHTVTAGEGTANSADIVTGWGKDVAIVSLTNQGSPTEAGLTGVNHATDGTVTVTATDLAANDVIVLTTTPIA